MTTKTIEWANDPEVAPRTIRAGSEADTLLRWDEVGRPLPKKVKAAVEAFVFLDTSAVPQASTRLKDAEGDLAAYHRADQRAVADALLAAAQKAQPIKLPADKLPTLAAEVREADRLYQGVVVASKAAYRLMIEELRAAGFDGLKLAEVWGDLMSFVPTDSIRANRAYEVHSAEVFGLVESLTLILEGGRDLSREEQKRLSRMFARRPSTLPRLADVRAEMNGEAEATPRAQAIKAAETSKKAQKIENRMHAQMDAKARLQGGDGTRNTAAEGGR